MRQAARWLSIAGACLLFTIELGAQRPRESTDGVVAVREIDALWAEALARRTRAADGRPGSRAWVQSARYELRASVSESLRSLRGAGMLRYRNRSPDTLTTIALGLAQNLFKAGSPHNEPVPITGGIELDTLCIAALRGAPSALLCGGGGERAVTRALRVQRTVAVLTLPVPLAPGDSIDLRAQWHFSIPTEDAPRMGSDGSVALLAYWYPQFAVYDDVTGWQLDPYLGTGEFSMDHADYDVRITVPAGFLVAATGELQNASEVLTPSARERLERARHSFAAVPIVNDSLVRARAATQSGPPLTWHFAASRVRDFAFYTSPSVVWDAMAAVVQRGGPASAKDTILVHAFYPARRGNWRRAADYGRQSIEHFSQLLWAYPWPQMSVVEGIVEGGMEYPMLTAVSVGGGARELLTTIAHEVGHMWFPMQVGSDERRFAWMDEGVASWMERSLLRHVSGRDDDDDGLPDLYRMLARTHDDAPMLTHADHYDSALSYTAASYDRLVVAFRAFAAEYGDSALVAGLRSYGHAWSWRHPYPPDLYRLVFAAAGAERDAFVDEWIRGSGVFDVRLGDVTRDRDTLQITVQSVGSAQLSVPVVITRLDRSVLERVIPAAAFRANPVQTLRIGGARTVASVVIDPTRRLPELDRDGQRWAP